MSAKITDQGITRCRNCGMWVMRSQGCSLCRNENVQIIIERVQK